jgi:NitT/TauT family transport system ATP-binding protein
MSLELKGIRKSFGGTAVLDGIDLKVDSGEVGVLLGPSGCGKTTLLRIVAGFVEPDEGSVAFSDEKCLSYVFQEPRLLPRASALDNIRLPLLGVMGGAEATSRAHRFLDVVGLSAQERLHPRRLSGGMRQRLALARGFAFPSDLLLMDEPFQSLDIALRSSLMDFFSTLWKEEPRSVLFVTHDPDEALYLGDNLHIMGGAPARIVDSFPVPGRRGERRLMDGPLLETERRVYEALLGGVWERKSNGTAGSP